MKNKILVIEDDRAISELLCMNLEAAGYETVAVYDGEEAQRLLLWHEDADLAVVDIMLPGKDGFALMEDFRTTGLPVIYLTAKDDVASKVKGLKLGAEDYMVKPFEMLELLVRIEKVLERTGRARKVLTIRNIMVDVQSHQVLKDGIPVNLKPMEYDLFVLLLQNKNIALGREELLKRVWGEDYLGESRTVDVHIGQLRKKLKLYDEIRTIPKLGYRLEE
ncbi:MAG: response regulator transcription factor [Eubacteriales bacterium]|nr:response regulator transcription factor [Eubacteriales bacterium]